MFAEVATACTEDTLTIAPPPADFSKVWASLTPRKTERRLDAMTASHSSVLVSSRGLAICRAALLISAFNDVVYAWACWKMLARFSLMEISAWMNNPVPGKPSPKEARSTPITRQPCRAKWLTAARPIPPAAPVMSTYRVMLEMSIYSFPASLVPAGIIPSPTNRLEMVFQCTRSQAVGLELALCGASRTLSIVRSGLSVGRGSLSYTSSAAPPSAPFCRASISAASSTIWPRAALTSTASRFINFKRRESISRRSEEHTSELQSRLHLVCHLLLEKKKKKKTRNKKNNINLDYADT